MPPAAPYKNILLVALAGCLPLILWSAFTTIPSPVFVTESDEMWRENLTWKPWRFSRVWPPGFFTPVSPVIFIIRARTWAHPTLVLEFRLFIPACGYITVIGPFLFVAEVLNERATFAKLRERQGWFPPHKSDLGGQARRLAPDAQRHPRRKNK